MSKISEESYNKQILVFKKKFKKKGINYLLEINLQENYLDVFEDEKWIYGIFLFDENELFDDPFTETKIDRILKNYTYTFHIFKKTQYIFISPIDVAELIFKIVLSKLNILSDTIENEYFHKYLEYDGVTKTGRPSKKFWEVTVYNGVYESHWGKIGSKGSKQIKSFSNNEDAKFYATKMINKKLKNGYRIIKNE